MGKTIGIVSLKGGVGKTSSVVSLGAALASFGKRVLLVDSNFSAPNLGIHLNLINPERTLNQVMEKIISPKDAVHTLENFDVLPSSMSGPVITNPLKLKDRLKSLKDEYDFIILDSSPALNEETLATMLASDQLFVVTTPDYSTLSTTLKAITLAKKRGTDIGGIILNKVYGKDFELSFDDIEKTAEVPIIAVVPHEVNVLESQANFTPITKFKPFSEVSDEFKKLAASLIGKKYKPFRFSRLFSWILPKKQEINRTIFYDRVVNSQ